MLLRPIGVSGVLNSGYLSPQSRDIAVTVKTASGLAVIRRFNSEEKRLTIGVCGQLRGEHGEDGDVGILSFQSTGCEVPRDPMHIMEAGAYTFKLSRRISW